MMWWNCELRHVGEFFEGAARDLSQYLLQIARRAAQGI
jgi:hypothetical protein